MTLVIVSNIPIDPSNQFRSNNRSSKSISFRGQLKILTKNAPNWIVVYVTSNDAKCGHEPNMLAGEGRND